MNLEFNAIDFFKYVVKRHEPLMVISSVCEDNMTLYECPSCHRTLCSERVFDSFCYCPYCGQALDW